jgi:hypothetical protein
MLFDCEVQYRIKYLDINYTNSFLLYVRDKVVNVYVNVDSEVPVIGPKFAQIGYNAASELCNIIDLLVDNRIAAYTNDPCDWIGVGGCDSACPTLNGLYLHSSWLHLTAIIKLQLVGIELNPGPCDWPGTGPETRENCRQVVRVAGKTHCPVCMKRVSRLSPGRPYFHEDVDTDEVSAFHVDSKRSVSAPESREIRAPRAAVVEAKCVEEVLTPAPIEKEVVIKPCEINVLAKPRPVSDMILGKISKGDKLIPEQLEQEGLCGFAVQAINENPRAALRYEVRNFTRVCEVDRRLPCHRGVDLLKDKILIQEITLSNSQSNCNLMYALIPLVFMLGGMAYYQYLISLPKPPQSLTDLLSVFLLHLLSSVGSVFGLFRSAVEIIVLNIATHVIALRIPWLSAMVNYWVEMWQYRVPVIVLRLAVSSIALMVLFVVARTTWFLTSIAHRWLNAERVYIHVPVITSAMLLDNFGSNSDELKANLATIFRRHIASVNVPSELVCAVQEGCVYVASMHIDGGLGFRLRAGQATL